MDKSKPWITIFPVTYGHYKHQLRVFLSSLMVQTDQNFKCLLMHDGPDINADFPLYNIIHPEYENKVELYFSEKRENCYGHNLRAKAIELCDTEFLCITNADNYYVPVWLEYCYKKVKEEADFIYYNTIHNYAGRAFGNPDYSLLDVVPFPSYIDIGSFIVRTSYAKKTGFNHRDYAADAWFVEDLKTNNPEMLFSKINSVLFIHN